MRRKSPELVWLSICADHGLSITNTAVPSRPCSLNSIQPGPDCTFAMLRLPVEQGMRACRDVMGDRMARFSTPDWSGPAPGFKQRMAEELERKMEGGANDLKISKELGLRHRDAAGRLIPVDDRRLDLLWTRAGELGVPVLIHGLPNGVLQKLYHGNARRFIPGW